MKKCQIENLETSENIENLEKVIASFLISEFSNFPYSQNRKLGFKNLGKKFPRFPSFRAGQKRPMKKHRKIAHKRSNLKQLRRICSNGTRSQRSFYYFHEKIQVKNRTRSQRQQFPEDLTERFEESERRTEADTQKRQPDIENVKKESSRIKKKKQWKDLERHENVRGKLKVTLEMKKKLKVQLRSGCFPSRKT